MGTSSLRLRFTVMHMQFRVIKDDAVIFERDFVEPNQSRLGAFMGIAVNEFQAKHPNISLLDEDVILKWSEVSAT